MRHPEHVRVRRRAQVAADPGPKAGGGGGGGHARAAYRPHQRGRLSPGVRVIPRARRGRQVSKYQFLSLDCQLPEQMDKILNGQCHQRMYP